VRFAFVKDNRSRYPVAVLCDVLSVSRSGFYAWARRPAESGRARRRAELAEQVRAAHVDSRRTYGSPRVTKALKASGVKACENTVARGDAGAADPLEGRAAVPRAARPTRPTPTRWPTTSWTDFAAARPTPSGPPTSPTCPPARVATWRR
jgi:hypothetical protein